MNRTRLVAGFMIVGGIGFGALGGEYSTMDWWTLHRAVRDEGNAISRLEGEIDSLAAAVRRLETDPATQERVARESFGMLRPGEILYRIEPGKEALSGPPAAR